MLIHNKDDIEFVTEFPCFLGHPVDIFLLDYDPINLRNKKTTSKQCVFDTNEF